MANPAGFAPGVLYARVPVPALPPAPARPAQPPVFDATAAERYTDPDLAAIAPYVDSVWYRGRYPDIATSGIDPVEHYGTAGWREARMPSQDFDPAWYLAAYPDIAAAGIEPLHHYITSGYREARRPIRPADRKRKALERSLRDAESQGAPPDAPALNQLALRRLIAATAQAAFGFVLSVSHDRYTDVTGGSQLVISDEQALFACARFAYLHISPSERAYRLLPPGGKTAKLQLVLDGQFIGLASAADLREALAAEAANLPARRLFILHSFFGYRASDLIALSAALAPQRSLFWLHDFGAICAGYNLLRDGLEFCGAPPPDSTACTICVYGARRAEDLGALTTMFTALRPVVVAPSQSALNIFRRYSKLPHAAAIVHPHAVLTAKTPLHTPRPQIGTAADPIRVAFVGYPLPNKGWSTFQNLADELTAAPGISLFHFAAPETLTPTQGLTCVPVQATAQARTAMIDALRTHAIDLVLLLSPWPETFSFVTAEAIAAGADVVALACSGNAAAMVRRFGRGIVLADEAALRDFLLGGAVQAYMRRVTREGRQYGTLRPIGTAATLGVPPSLDLPTTDEPRLTPLAGAARLDAHREGWTYAITLPEGCASIRLLSRRTPDGSGILVSAIKLDDRDLSLDDPALGAGWGKTTAGARLTSGDASLATGGAHELRLTLRPEPRYPLLPIDAD